MPVNALNAFYGHYWTIFLHCLSLHFDWITKANSTLDCPVWHTSLTVADSSRIESIQRRAVEIIEPEFGYDVGCSKHHLDNTSVRRENSSKKCFTSINFASHRLHHLLPYPKSNRYSLRNSSKLPCPENQQQPV